jgi:hypothetical protein
MSDPKVHNQSKNYSTNTDDDQPPTDYGDGYSNYNTGGDQNVGSNTTTSRTSTNYPPPKFSGTGTGTGTTGTGGAATGGSIPSIQGDPDAQAYLQQLIDQGFSDTQIMQMYQAHTGQTLSQGDLAYAKQGFGAFDGPYPSQYKGYGTYTTKLQGQYGSPQWNQWLQNQQTVQDAKEMVRDSKKKAHEEKVKIHMILLQILMGDIVGALRSYAILMDRDNRQFTRMIVNKLQKVRETRSTVIRNFGMYRPPSGYAGKSSTKQVQAQNAASKYTQFVQLSTQVMNELQNTERELVDSLQTQWRDIEKFWESYSSMRDEKFRTDEKVMSFH